MILYAITGFSILAAVFFMVRSQGMQVQLRQLQHSSQKNEKHKREILHQLTDSCEEVQRLYLNKLEAAYHSGLINNEKYEKSKVIISHYSYVVLCCVDKQMTLQGAMKKVAIKSQTPFDDIQRFISLQPSDIRAAWSSNQVKGFIRVCSLLCEFETQALANAS